MFLRHKKSRVQAGYPQPLFRKIANFSSKAILWAANIVNISLAKLNFNLKMLALSATKGIRMNNESEPQYEYDPPPNITRFMDIPKILHSVEKDMPFNTCLKCGADLLTTNRYYVIEKVFRRNEVIIELAMCLDCRGGHADEGMSEKSSALMKSFVEEKINFRHRLELMAQVNEEDSIDPWLERCILSDEPSQIFSEYQLVALCKGPWIQRDFYPALVSGKSIEEMSSLLSEETRDWMDDFIGDNFGMPSEFCDSPISPMLM